MAVSGVEDPQKNNEETKGDDSEGTALIAIKAIAIIFIAIMVLAYVTPKPTNQNIMFGVKVVSEIPLEKLTQYKAIALFNESRTGEEITCKFELSAISTPSPNGYRVQIQEGDFGIYIGEKEAQIKGSNPSEILNACHAFACLRDGIDCPDDFLDVDDMIGEAKSISIILDENVRRAGGRGYVEIMGALSFYQNSRADKNKDGKVGQIEVNANEFFIYPFLMTDEGCIAQPLHNVLQNWSGSEDPIDCANIGPVIILEKADKASMKLEGNRLTLRGDDDLLHTQAIIVRDIISPRWIRRMYGLP